MLILDEVDQLRDTGVLYDLHSVRGLSWICIANREVDLLAGLDDRVSSRVSVGYRVTFNKYDDATVTEILDRRARAGLTPNAVTREVLARIASHSDGDARTAITALRVAAKQARGEGLSSIPRRLVDVSVLDAEQEVRQKTVSKLNHHQRVLYEVIRDFGPCIQKELYERYQHAHSSPISLRALRENHLPKLEHYNLIRTERNGGGKMYSFIG